MQVARQQLNLRRALTEHLFTFSRQKSKPLLKIESINKAGCFDIDASSLELVSKELNHFGVIADLFRQIGVIVVDLCYFALFENKND